MKWIKWYGQQWLNSTARYELSEAERGVFLDFCSLASIETIGLQPGQFKVASWQALAHKLNSDVDIVVSAKEKCLKSRIEVEEDDKEGIIVTVLNWAKYQAIKSVSRNGDDAPNSVSRFSPQIRRDKKRRDKSRVDVEEEQRKTDNSNNFSPTLVALTKGCEGLGILIAPTLGDDLKTYAEEYTAPISWIEDAFREAADNNVRKWAYVRTILDTWQAEGRPDKSAPARRGQQRPGSKPGDTPNFRGMTQAEKDAYYIGGKHGDVIRH
uniref:Putative DnaB domain protein n=1 Tax=viral metagenome TaxID=1070528 RepID=A0A6M3XYP9_9ZZZZ